ncbi:MFS transporter [Bacillus cereus]|uniref:MFS transporter n=1 Tax=Bacillus cereus TaxID=1396 RepID=UPI000BF58288|nr:MFS transporter [Bacillus cereus]MCD2338622.1 MFS transporter [Bacillus cereus]MCD2338708.1 MFS transporter [Bacillus cereus]MDG1570406.1 MFS transporter [Bacillus cereus]PEX21404.1 hypothetical protein CN458_28475 [Bacillus cereus]PFT87842.1 hypothetical protein COK66_27935 [Bacillus cereus]
MWEIIKEKNSKLIILNNLFAGLGSGLVMIGISWYLVQMNPENGGHLGWIMLLTSIITFLVSPNIGVLIDRYSRKKFFLIVQTIMVCLVTISIMLGQIFSYNLFILSGIYLISTIYFTIHYPLVSALVQETFKSSSYQQINSLLEIEGQVAAMLSGALAALILKPLGLSGLLVLDALLYAGAVLVMWFYDYKKEVQQQTSDEKLSLISNFKESWGYIKLNFTLIIFLMMTLVPYAVVVLSNYLTPIYVSQNFNNDPSVFSISELSYALGAIIVGFFSFWLAKRLGEINTIFIYMLLFGLVFLTFAMLNNQLVLWGGMAIVGLCNAGVRIIRNTLIMKLIPKNLIGRINTILQSFFTLIRVVLLSMFTFIMSSQTLPYIYISLGFIILAAGMITLLGGRLLYQGYNEVLSTKQD